MAFLFFSAICSISAGHKLQCFSWKRQFFKVDKLSNGKYTRKCNFYAISLFDKLPGIMRELENCAGRLGRWFFCEYVPAMEHKHMINGALFQRRWWLGRNHIIWAWVIDFLPVVKSKRQPSKHGKITTPIVIIFYKYLFSLVGHWWKETLNVHFWLVSACLLQ